MLPNPNLNLNSATQTYDPQTVHEAIIQRLSSVIDPETGVDVIRMRLIEELQVNEQGHVTYRFRPSSPLCPLAVPIAQMIKQAVAEVVGVVSQELEVVGYVQAEALTAMMRQVAP
jgi:metal-sulfur cluster biosynthetic enzyme